VNGQLCPLRRLFLEELSSGKLSEDCVSGQVPEQRSSGRFPEKQSSEILLLPEERCSESFNFFFGLFKMLYFPNYLILINKLSYKINNIIIHKLLLVNIIMTNICNSFFTRM